MVINIRVANKRPVVLDAPVIVCGNSDYSIRFTFDDEWKESAVKTVRFAYVQNGEAKYQEVVIDSYTAPVPILTNTREVLVGVYAGELRTTTPARIPCERSILCGSDVHDAPPEDVYQQLLKLIEEGGGSVSPAMVEQIVEDYLTENPPDVGGDVEKRLDAIEASMPKETTTTLKDEDVAFEYDGIAYFGMFATDFNPVNGEEYTVTIDGTPYTATAGTSLKVGGYEFLVGQIIYGVDDGTHHIVITRSALLLPEEHFPENVAKAEEDFELIDTVEITEAGLTSVTRNFDRPRKHIMMVAVAPTDASVTSEYSCYLQCRREPWADWNDLPGVGGKLHSNRSFKAFFVPKNGLWDLHGYHGSNVDSSAAVGQVFCGKIATLNEYPAHKLWRFYTTRSGGFPVGVTIRVYGVKEDA